MTFAFDRTSRRIDADGRLHVAMTNISKAVVNPYYGREIPGFESLGLDGDRVYQLLRHPDELEKAAPTFNNLQLLSRHIPVAADKNPAHLVVGSTGTDCVFKPPYLQNSLVVWDSVAVAGIETMDKCQLSAAYRYQPVMEPGAYEGERYDGVMTNIIGNHVALVEVGRAGSDVVVADSVDGMAVDEAETGHKPEGEPRMKTKAELLADLVKPFLATDAAPDFAAIVTAMDEHKEPDGDEPKEGESEEEYKARMAKKTPAVDEDKDDKPTKAAMDEAIAGVKADTVKTMRDIQAAEKIVSVVIGEVVAQDSAEAVYKLALDHLALDVEGVHPSAYASLVKMAIANMNKKPAVVAQDSGEGAQMFPEAVKLKRC